MFDHAAQKAGEVLGSAAGHERPSTRPSASTQCRPPVDVGRRLGQDVSAPGDYPGLHQAPRAVTDGGDGSTLTISWTKTIGIGVDAQPVGVDGAAGSTSAS